MPVPQTDPAKEAAEKDFDDLKDYYLQAVRKS